MSAPASKFQGTPRGATFPEIPYAALATLSLMGVSLWLVAAQKFTLALLIVVMLPAAIAFARSPDLAAPVVAFVLWTNAAVIAVKFHGVPFVVGAAFPLLLTVPLARAVLLRGERIIIAPAFLWLLAYLAVQLVGALFAIRPEESIANWLESAAEAIMFYLLVSNVIRTPQILRRVVCALLAAAVLIGALSAHQQLTGAFEDNYGGFAQATDAIIGGSDGDGQIRLAGPIGEKNRFAQIMAMLLPLALFMSMAAKDLWTRVLAVAGVASVMICIALSASRGAVVGVGLMFAVMLAMGTIRWRHLVLPAVAISLTMLAIPKYAERVLSLADTVRVITGSSGVASADGATRGRVAEMMSTALVFADHPVIGAGPGMNAIHYREYARLTGGKVAATKRRAHSLYPAVAAEHGVLGLVAFSGMLIVTFRDLLRARRVWLERDPEIAAIVTAIVMTLVVYLTTSLFLHSAYVRYFWLMMGITAAASHVITHTERDRGTLARLQRVSV